MSNEKCETARECDEHLAIKNGSSGNSNVTPGILLNRIKFEDSELDWDECGIDIKEAVKTEIKNGWKVNSGSEGFEVPDTIEQGFIKNEADQDTEEISEMDLNSMKSEPSNDDWDECDAGNQSILDTDVDELEMGMYSKIKEEPFIKDEMDDNTERISDILLRRIKNEYNEVDELPECSITENLNIHLREIKSEIDICEEFNKKEMASEGTIENETLNGISNAFSNSVTHTKKGENSLMPTLNLHKHMKEKHCNSVAPASSKLYRCKKCIYITRTKDSYRKHLLKHPKTAGLIKPTTCIHCNAEFRSQLSHDDHVVKKHPGCIKSVTRKLHSCTECPYQTIIKSNFDKHVSIHSKTTTSDFSKCIYCDAMFKNKVSVDDHIVKNHPNFISSVARKIYECTECTYKTVQKSILDAHMSKHSSSGYERFNCMHCKATFKFKISCDDHVVQKHPEFIKSLTRKLHGCSECSYKTAIKSNLSKHVSQHVVHPSSRKWKCSQCDAIFKSKGALHNHVETHSETASSDEISKCEHCDATFKCEISLDDHIARKHTSSSNKLHECTECNYKTAVKSKFNKHMTTHIGTASRYKCTYIDCNAVFKSQDSLDDHVVKKHPYSISSVSTKIYECTECNYKTTLKYKLGKHMLVHPESHSSYELGTCTHCSAVFKSEKALDEHVVREHPKFIKSLERKIYRCTECIYKTVFKYKFERHMSAHPETDSS